jgi:hypothetical protein
MHGALEGRAGRGTVWACLVLLGGCLDAGDPPDPDADPDAEAGVDAAGDVPVAPPETWVWRVANLVDRDYANVVVELPDGGVMLAGYVTDDAGTVIGTSWVAAFGPDGSFRWGRRLPPTGMWLAAGAPDPRGGVLLAGRGGRFGTADEGLLLWLREDGTVLSARTVWPGATGDITTLSAAPAGGWLVAGSRSPGGAATGDRAWVARLEADGTPIWSVLLPDLQPARRGSIAATAHGGAVLASSRSSDGAARLVRLGPDGTPRWQRRVPAALGSTVLPYPSAAVAADGDVALAYPDDGDIVVVRFADDGALRWRARVGGTAEERGGPLVGTPDGGLLVGGTRNSLGETFHDTWLAALDPAGGLAWERTVWSDRLEEVHDLRLTGDGGLLAVAGGCCTSIVVRLGLDGSFDGSCDVLQPTGAVSEVGMTPVGEETPRIEPLDPTVYNLDLALEPDTWAADVLCE